jgi:hypothetical protein
MSNTTGIIWRSIIAAVLSANVALLSWTINTVVEHGKSIVITDNKINHLEFQAKDMQDNGTRKFQAHEAQDDDRVKTIREDIRDLKMALISVQSIASDMGAIKAKVDSLTKSQDRIEVLLSPPK